MKDARGHGSDGRGGTPVVRLDTVGSRGLKTGYLAGPKPKYAENTSVARAKEGGSLSSATAETLAAQRAADESRYPTSTVTDRMAAMSLGQGHPKSEAVPLGSSFSTAKSDLDRARSVALPRGAENRRAS